MVLLLSIESVCEYPVAAKNNRPHNKTPIFFMLVKFRCKIRLYLDRKIVKIGQPLPAEGFAGSSTEEIPERFDEMRLVIITGFEKQSGFSQPPAGRCGS